MKKLTLSLLLAVMCAGVTSLAFADTLKFTGTTYNGQIGPYQFHVNSSLSFTYLVCASDNNTIYTNETWQVDIYNISNVASNSVFPNPPETQAQWNEAAWYAAHMVLTHNSGDSANNTKLQNDIWAAMGLGGSYDTGVGSWHSQWLAFIGAYPSWKTSALFYIPIPGTQSTGGIPQPFITITPTPEPASLLLLGSGLLGAFLRRKRSA